MMHVADAEYYSRVQETIARHPNRAILYERIKPLTPEQEALLSSEERLLVEDFKRLMAGMQDLGRSASLSFQLKELVYSDDWVNTDIAMLDLVRAFAKQKLRLSQSSDGGGKAMDNSPVISWLMDKLFSNMVPLQLAARFLGYFSRKRRQRSRIILEQRNQIAIASIRDFIRSGHDVTTLWGGAHLPGIDSALRADGFREYHREWLDAYRTRGYTLKTLFKALEAEEGGAK